MKQNLMALLLNRMNMKKYIAYIPVYALASIFTLFSVMFFKMVFTHTPLPMVPGIAGLYSRIMISTHYLYVVKTLEFVIGIMMFIPRTRKLALVMIAPIIVNIFLYELLMMKSPGMSIVLIVLDAIALYQYRRAYMPMIQK